MCFLHRQTIPTDTSICTHDSQVPRTEPAMCNNRCWFHLLWYRNGTYNPYDVNAPIESLKITDICFAEKVTIQNKLLDAENETDCLHI